VGLILPQADLMGFEPATRAAVRDNVYNLSNLVKQFALLLVTPTEEIH